MRFLVLFTALLFTANLSAQFGVDGLSKENEAFDRPIGESIFIDKSSIKPGDEFKVIVELKIKENWKVYWKVSGGISGPMKFKWNIPEGIQSLGDVNYPYPKYTFDEASAANFYNDGTVIYTAGFKVSEETKPGTIDLGLVVDWQACKKNGQCIFDFNPPERVIKVNVSASSQVIPDNVRKIEMAQQYFPGEAPQGWKLHAYKTQKEYKGQDEDKASVKPVVVVTLQSPENINPVNIQFFPENEAFAFQANPRSFQIINSNTVQKVYEIVKNDEDKFFKPGKISGVVTLYQADSKKSDVGADIEKLRSALKKGEPCPVCGVDYEGKESHSHYKSFKLSADISSEEFVTEGKTAQKYRSADDAPVVKAEDTSLILNLFLAFLGGFILNLMPCVFPVLSIKVMGFVNQAQEGKSHAVKHAMIFTLGAMLSFWALAGSMLAIKAVSGTNVDWGYQLQNPYVVLSLILVLFIMALNLFGLFEIGIGLTGAGQKVQGKTGMSGSFFSGILATVVATPCMAPMLGAALTYAFTQPAAIAMLIFTFICLGMCSPYIVLAMSPRLLKFIPKPGAWMETFKQSMGFLMLLAVVWLLETLQKQIEFEAYLYNILWGFTGIAAACWIYGKYCPMFQEKKTRIRGFIAVLIVGGLSLTYAYGKVKEKPAVTWVDFDVAKLEEYRRQGVPVFVDFTATWCATCQVNKKVAIYPNAQLFKQKGVVTMKADNTKQDPLISEWLREYDSTGVPLNLLFDGQNPLPVKFPESYTAGTLADVLQKLPDRELPEELKVK